jgi:hypothetical protein
MELVDMDTKKALQVQTDNEQSVVMPSSDSRSSWYEKLARGMGLIRALTVMSAAVPARSTASNAILPAANSQSGRYEDMPRGKSPIHALNVMSYLVPVVATAPAPAPAPNGNQAPARQTYWQRFMNFFPLEWLRDCCCCYTRGTQSAPPRQNAAPATNAGPAQTRRTGPQRFVHDFDIESCVECVECGSELLGGCIG